MDDYIRISTFNQEDNSLSVINQVLQFYDDYPDEGNRVRDARELIKAGKSGDIYKVTDAANSMIGIACIFNHQNGYREAGGTRIIRNGLGLQKILHKCRLITSLMLEVPAGGYFTIVDKDNHRSINGTKKCGFDEWEPTNSFKTVVGKLDQVDKLFFDFDLRTNKKKAQLAKHAQDLLDLHNGKPIVGADGEQTRVVFDYPVFTQSRLLNIVEQIAADK